MALPSSLDRNEVLGPPLTFVIPKSLCVVNFFLKGIKLFVSSFENNID
jgi:hypothetical protein